MLQIGDIVTVKSSPGIPATITGVLHEKSETYTLTDEVVNGRYVWARETITIYMGWTTDHAGGRMSYFNQQENAEMSHHTHTILATKCTSSLKVKVPHGL